jgi:hypothetical protein
MALFQKLSEGLARRTSRRGLVSRGAQGLFGALAGAAAGTIAHEASAGFLNTSCQFPGPPCDCDKCWSNGVCAKPCVILTQFYATGCWVSATGATCCDCHCVIPSTQGWCGCGTDYHNSLVNCPHGTADDLP